MNSQNKVTLIDRYVAEVGRQLPEKQRADVQLELRSALQDALDERGLDADKKADEAKVASLLKEWGRPSNVAEGYGARNYLIGPELLPYYWTVLRFAAFVATLVQVVLLGVGAFNETNIAALIGRTVGNLIDSYFTAFAVITIIFALLERFTPGLHLPAQEWDPRTLPEITTDRDKVNYFETLFEIIFTAIFISVINLLPGWQVPADLPVVGELVQFFLPFIPWVTALAVVEIILDAYLLSQGRWQPLTRWIAFAHAVASTIVAGVMLSVAPYSSVALADTIVRISIGVVFAISLIDTAVKLYKALRPGAPMPWEAWRLEQAIEDVAEQGEALGKAFEERIKNTRKKK